MSVPDNLDPELRKYGTPRQQEYFDALQLHGGARAAGRALDIDHAMILRGIKAMQAKAARGGYAPEYGLDTPAAPGMRLARTTTLYKPDPITGQPVKRLQWVRNEPDQDAQQRALEDYVGWLVADARGLSPAIPAPTVADTDLLAVYPMGDPHFGLYAWAEEAGEDFNLDEAERLTCAAIDRLVASAPPADTGLILELGDFFHSDNESNQTSRSGHALDVDTRWAKVMQVGLRAMTYVVKRALEKHRVVVVRIVKGNHDGHSSFALALALDAYFSNNERVQVDLSPASFWYFRWGQVLIGSTHGDTCKMNDMPLVMATDRAADWGETSYRYWYAGHVHHDQVKEYPGVKCETFRTLAARDAWHAGAGYRAGRDMRCIVHHRLYGEVERHRCDVAMIARAA